MVKIILTLILFVMIGCADKEPPVVITLPPASSGNEVTFQFKEDFEVDWRSFDSEDSIYFILRDGEWVECKDCMEVDGE